MATQKPAPKKPGEKPGAPPQIHNVTLIMDDGSAKVIKCADNVYILDAAEDANLELPYSCRAGSCSTCLGIVQAGQVDQNDQTFLDKAQLKKGFALTCVSYPVSDVTILTHQESNLFQ